MSERHTILKLFHTDEFFAEELDVGDRVSHQEPIVAEPAPALAAGESHEQRDVVREEGEGVHLDVRAGDHLIAAARHHHVNACRGQCGQALKWSEVNRK